MDVRQNGRLEGFALQPIHHRLVRYEQAWARRFGPLENVLAELEQQEEAVMTVQTSNGTAKVTLPSDRQILITREFNAPRHLVYRAWTTPELVKRWWSGDMGETTLAEIDLRVGGTWRYVMVANGGMEVGFHGEFREIVPDERIVSTEVFEGAPDAAAVNTLTLSEVDGRTTLSVLVDHTSKEHRDAHINSGMEGGMQKSFDALERVAVSLA